MKQQEQGIEMNEMSMCRVTCKDEIKSEHIQRTTRVAQASKKITGRRLVRDERRTHTEENAEDGYTRKMKRRLCNS